MATYSGSETASDTSMKAGLSSGLGFALALGALAAVGAGIAIQQLLDRRLTKPEKARLQFYRYLRDKGHLES